MRGGAGGSREPCSGQHAVGSAAGSLGRIGLQGLKRQEPGAARVGTGTGTPDDVGRLSFKEKFAAKKSLKWPFSASSSQL